MSHLTNDNATLVPKTPSDGRFVEFDLPAMKVGVAQYDEGPTGCTVFYFPSGVTTEIDVRGEFSGTFGGYEWNHAICLAGGSLYSLEAIAGVQAELFAQGGYSTAWGGFKLVSGAIIYDYGPRANAIYPDKELGRFALREAHDGRFPIGRAGAGCAATVGNGFDFTRGEWSGQGAAYRQAGKTKIAVFTVVNALGAIVDREGNVRLGHRNDDGTRYHVRDQLEAKIARGEPTRGAAGNTTLTVVVTNQRLPRLALRQIGRQVHTSMARAIQPFHSWDDGDVLYMTTTNEIDNPLLSETALGVLASELAWDAVLSIVDVA